MLAMLCPFAHCMHHHMPLRRVCEQKTASSIAASKSAPMGATPSPGRAGTQTAAAMGGASDSPGGAGKYMPSMDEEEMAPTAFENVSKLSRTELKQRLNQLKQAEKYCKVCAGCFAPAHKHCPLAYLCLCVAAGFGVTSAFEYFLLMYTYMPFRFLLHPCATTAAVSAAREAPAAPGAAAAAGARGRGRGRPRRLHGRVRTSAGD